MYNFNCGDKVWIKSLEKLGTVITARTGGTLNCRRQNPVDTQPIYEVMYQQSIFNEYADCNVIDCVGKKNVYIHVTEDDLVIPVEKKPMLFIKDGTITPEDIDNLRRLWNEQVRLWNEQVAQSMALVCECGMEKHGFASHSDWCPKHT